MSGGSYFANLLQTHVQEKPLKSAGKLKSDDKNLSQSSRSSAPSGSWPRPVSSTLWGGHSSMVVSLQLPGVDSGTLPTL
jgi:hypothetical protein